MHNRLAAVQVAQGGQGVQRGRGEGAGRGRRMTGQNTSETGRVRVGVLGCSNAPAISQQAANHPIGVHSQRRNPARQA